MAGIQSSERKKADMDPSKTDQALRNRTVIPRNFYFPLFVFILFLLFRVFPPGIGIPAAGAAEIKTNCSIHAGACSQHLPGIEITLDITPKPVRAMQDLVFRISLAGEAPDRTPVIDLGMPAMEMGPNRVILNKISRKVYEGKGVIVRCPSGHRTWQATVTIPGRGKADFIFDVVY